MPHVGRQPGRHEFVRSPDSGQGDDYQGSLESRSPIKTRAGGNETAKGGITPVSAGGRRNKVHPRNWGYSTYIDRVFGMRCFEDLVRLRVFPDAKDISESFGALQGALRHGIGGPTDSAAREAERRPGVLCICVGDGSTPRTACLAAFLSSWHCVSVDPALKQEWTGKDPRGVLRLRGVQARFEEFIQDTRQIGVIRSEVAVQTHCTHLRDRAARPKCETRACSTCGEVGHLTRHCPVALCRSCGEAGHIARDCPLKAQKVGSALEGAAASPQACADRTESSATTPPTPGPALEHLLLLCVHAHHRFRGPASIDTVRQAFGNPSTSVVSLPCCPTFNPTKDIGRPPDSAYEDAAIFSACRQVLVWRFP